MNMARTAAEVLTEHTTLELECIERMYLNVYVPMLQTGGGTAAIEPPTICGGCACADSLSASHTRAAIASPRMACVPPRATTGPTPES